jgi:hypothetical protein
MDSIGFVEASMPNPHARVQAQPGSPAAEVVFAGVDTHTDLHVAAVIDARENILGTAIETAPLTAPAPAAMLASGHTASMFKGDRMGHRRGRLR